MHPLRPARSTAPRPEGRLRSATARLDRERGTFAPRDPGPAGASDRPATAWEVGVRESRRESERAIADYSAALKLNPRLAPVLRQRAALYRETDRIDLALTASARNRFEQPAVRIAAIQSLGAVGSDETSTTLRDLYTSTDEPQAIRDADPYYKAGVVQYESLLWNVVIGKDNLDKL